MTGCEFEADRGPELEFAGALEGHVRSRSTLDLLVFWGYYPNGWFQRGAISPVTFASRAEVSIALDELVELGVVVCRLIHGIPRYALTKDCEVRSAVIALARMTPNGRRYLLHHGVTAADLEGAI